MAKVKTGAPGTTDQMPRWEGPPENRPAGYLPAEDNPDVDRDAAGENLQDPDRSTLTDATTTKDNPPSSEGRPSREDRIRNRAYELWDADGRQQGSHEHHWHQAAREIDDE